MARKVKHPEHVNAEAWAIPYGDLVTLLFALFTVMYAVSSVNAGKFRVLSASMSAAINGTPKSIQPINVGDNAPGKGGDRKLVGAEPTAMLKSVVPRPPGIGILDSDASDVGAGPTAERQAGAMARMQKDVEKAMKTLIEAKAVSVRRENLWLEIEINTDLLFPSGAADFAPAAAPVLDKLAEVLKPFPNAIRVEGHTDDRPIHTAEFPSNWELSAARAASVVHQMTKQGIDPLRLEIVGFGEYRPRQSNSTPEGRSANRRVAIMVLEGTKPAGDVMEAGHTASGSTSTALPAAGDATTALKDHVPPAGQSNHKLEPGQAPVELNWPATSPVGAPPPKHP